MTNRNKAILYTAGIVAAIPSAMALSILLATHYPKETMIAFCIGIAGWMIYSVYGIVKTSLDMKDSLKNYK